MVVLVTGVNGQLGHDVVNELVTRGHTCIGSGSSYSYRGINDESAVTTIEYVSMDITNSLQVYKVLSSIQPEAVIHCAAWTDVDGAEDPSNISKVYAINAGGTQNLAKACAMIGCKMMYISTDYVFNGLGEKPWKPDCKDFAPLNEYGKSKLEGELAVTRILDNYFVVRIAWVFGLNGKNFVKTMLKLGQTHNSLRVVNDQIGTPTYTKDLARLLVDMIETGKYGYYHATNEGGYISWYDFACAIFKQAGMNIKVIPVSTDEYALSKAARPFNSRLDKSKLRELSFEPLPDWRNALERYLKELGNS